MVDSGQSLARSPSSSWPIRLLGEQDRDHARTVPLGPAWLSVLLIVGAVILVARIVVVARIVLLNVVTLGTGAGCCTC